MYGLKRCKSCLLALSGLFFTLNAAYALDDVDAATNWMAVPTGNVFNAQRTLYLNRGSVTTEMTRPSQRNVLLLIQPTARAITAGNLASTSTVLKATVDCQSRSLTINEKILYSRLFGQGQPLKSEQTSDVRQYNGNAGDKFIFNTVCQAS